MACLGVPDPPANCSISNQTVSSFEIDCSEGYDGGIPQHFKMHVFDIKSRSLLANLTSSSPRFALHLGGAGSSPGSPSGSGEADNAAHPRTHSWKSSSNNANSILLDGGADQSAGGAETKNKRHQQQVFGSIAVIPAVGTLLQVTAVNAHGASDSVYIDATSILGLLPPEQQGGHQAAGSNSAGFQFTPTLGILAGLVVTAVVMMGALVACLRFRLKKKPPGSSGAGGNSAGSGEAASVSLMSPPIKEAANKDRLLMNSTGGGGNDYIELGTKDPDVINKGEFVYTSISSKKISTNTLRKKA